jgi:hypothetical protein
MGCAGPRPADQIERFAPAATVVPTNSRRLITGVAGEAAFLVDASYGTSTTGTRGLTASSWRVEAAATPQAARQAILRALEIHGLPTQNQGRRPLQLAKAEEAS